ncbi:MAG TPA: hypothetical protein VGO50_07805 [Pyrinomonadaceae bacterium]|jgi:hypothetical protein|nr:hypothetical protein [Pyrinomonadaceae bacterium]
MSKPVKILLQTTIPDIEDDWHIGRFSLLHAHLDSLRDENGEKLYEVIARDREVNENGDDTALSSLNGSDFDQLWLFAVDTGSGLSANDCAGITKFRQRGGGIFSTRDHNDLGSSLCTLGGIGEAHYFHSKHRDPDEERNVRDNQDNLSIDYPNYDSGSNGDYQKIDAAEPHPLLQRTDSGTIEYFPAHPHEGGVGVPQGSDTARVIATGTSRASGRPFNLVVAFERGTDRHGNHCGRAIAESSFHHLVDYNWDTEMGCPSFLEEPPGTGIKDEPEKLNDIKKYVENLAAWLSPK